MLPDHGNRAKREERGRAALGGWIGGIRALITDLVFTTQVAGSPGATSWPVTGTREAPIARRYWV